MNLAWKFAAVLRGRANRAILDSYETERISFARRLVASTDQAFTGLTSSGALARALRLRIVPFVIPLLFAFRATQRLMFRTVSQTAVNYRGSPLSEGHAGRLHGGDRLPWVKTGSVGPYEDNFKPLRSLSGLLYVRSYRCASGVTTRIGPLLFRNLMKDARSKLAPSVSVIWSVPGPRKTVCRPLKCVPGSTVSAEFEAGN